MEGGSFPSNAEEGDHAIARAQKQVTPELLRPQHLLEYDDVMNKTAAGVCSLRRTCSEGKIHLTEEKVRRHTSG